MTDYISREAALEAMGSLLRQHFLCVPDSLAQAAATAGYMDGVKDADIRLRSIPAADVRPVVRGKWKLGGYGQISDATEKWYDKYLSGGFLYCSVCKGRTSVKFNFCPNCGAMMKKS